MIQFDMSTVGPPVDHDKLERFTDMIRRDLPTFSFPQVYLDMLEETNGGKPINCYFRIDGGSHPIEYFLNIGSTDESVDMNTRLLNVSVFWSEIHDRLSCNLIPFAVTPFGDALCFKYNHSIEEPVIVLWYHEKSEEDNPYTEFVAKDFLALCKGLHRKE